MKKTTLENKTDRLWKGYDNEQSKAFWKKYDKLIKQAKSKQQTTVPEVIPAAKLIQKTEQDAFYSQYYLHHKKRYAVLASEVAAYVAFGILVSPVFLVVIGFSVQLCKHVTQKHLLNFQIAPRMLIVHNKKQKTSVAHAWDKIAFIALIHRLGAYHLEITTYESKTYFYPYTLSQKDHKEFFAQLKKKVSTTEKTDYYKKIKSAKFSLNY